MIEPAFKIILDGNNGVNTLTAGRTFHNFADEDERRTRIVFTLIDRVDEHDFQGSAGYCTGTMQIACLAPTYTAAKQLAAAVVSAIDNYVGTTDGTTFGWIQCVEQRDIPAAPLAGQAKPTCGVSVDADFLAVSGF